MSARLVKLTGLEILSDLRSSYWFVPLLLMLAAGALAIGVLLVDEYLDYAPPAFLRLVYPTSPEGARALLSAIVGSMITAISVTFSVTIVALTVAADHFGPRVLTNFVRHTSAQVVLGTFIGTFVYAVMVMGAVRGTETSSRIPQLAVATAVVLVILSVVALIYYVHHVSTTLQVGQIAAEIAHEFESALARVPEATDEDDESEQLPPCPADAAPILADSSGYVQRIDVEAVARAADETGVRIWMNRPPGHFVLKGTPLASVAPSAAVSEEIIRRINGACVLGSDRTMWQDPEFAVEQLVEVALRALSPGVNEPFTALTCIDRLSQALGLAAAAPPRRRVWRSRDGTGIVFMQSQSFIMLLNAAMNPIRVFAGRNPAIVRRSIDALADVATLARTRGRREALRDQATLLRTSAAETITNPDDLASVDRHFAAAAARFQWPD